MDVKLVFLYGITIIGLLAIGFFGNNIYRDYTNERDYNGLWIPSENITKLKAMEIASQYDSIGEWICVNIKGMSLDTMENTIRHEIGHEVFARKCAKNWDNCLEVINGIN